jgi:hypothetical protein
METDGLWYIVDQTTDSSTRMLGIYVLNSGSNKGYILLEGHCQVEYADNDNAPFVGGADNLGKPIFIKQDATGLMSEKPPTTGYSRVVGHTYWDTGVDDIAIITEDVEIVTINVENADVYLANGVVSHNKGTTTQPFIPSGGLRMYLDPSKASSTNGTATTDWLDLSGWGTGVRPAGVQNAAGVSGANPTYTDGGSRKEKYWSLDTNKFWYKDGTTNINGGYTQFNTTEYSVIAWVRFTSHPASGYYNFFNKQNTSGASNRLISLYINSNGSGTYSLYDGTPLSFASTGTSLSTNVWYMVSYTAAANGTNVAYFDSTSKGTVSNGAQTYTTSGLIQIGGNYTEGTDYFNGQLGPVLFYNRQLSGTEIAQVYNYFSPTYK